MRPSALVTCLWPGLAPLWWRGVWSGLYEAAAFTLGFNLLLVATFVWPQWIGSPWPMLGWVAVAVFWLSACWRAWRNLPNLVDSRPDAQSEVLFTRAQAEYLKGNWYDAEKQVEQLLARRPRDVEGLLLLATLQRHTQRTSAAQATLERLQRLDGAERWTLEIHHERTQLKRQAEEEGSSGAAQGQNNNPAREDTLAGAPHSPDE